MLKLPLASAFLIVSLAGFWAAAQPKTVFPLKTSPNKRHLVDQKGQPFLYVSDSGWKLFAGLTEAETKEYLQKRQAQGFNTIHVMLTALPGDKNRQGHEPFENLDFAKPNEAWFKHVDRAVAIADSMNMLLAIAPLWYSCCNDGWASHPQKPMQRNGPEKATCLGSMQATATENSATSSGLLVATTTPATTARRCANWHVASSRPPRSNS